MHIQYNVKLWNNYEQKGAGRYEELVVNLYVP
jgi:hypothetical protein